MLTCILLLLGMCNVIKDKPVLVMSVVQAGVMLTDYQMTNDIINHDPCRCHVETGGLRSFTGPDPTWNKMAPVAAISIIASSIIADHIYRSHNKWVRKAWWIPQISLVIGNAEGIHQNLGLKPPTTYIHN